MLRILSVLLAFAIVSLTSPESASAGGYEYPGDGARAMGRGAANLARADDPMTMFINPAGLGSLPGIQFMMSAHLTFMKACIERLGVDGAELEEYDASYGGGKQEKICNGGGKISNRLTLVPSIGVTFRASKAIGIGIGIHPPNSVQKMIWGDDVGSRGSGDTAQELPGFVGDKPSPVRYQLVDDDVIVAYPTIAIGVKPVKWLQFGASFAAGFANFKVNNYTRATLDANSPGGEDQLLDVPTSFSVKDRFVPRFVASVHLIPHDRLDIVAAIRVEDTIHATGKIKAQTILGDGAGKIRYNAPRPMWVSGGIRYAHRLRARADDSSAVSELSGRVEDQMSNELFDIEVNVVYEKNTEVKDHTFTVSGLTVGTLPGFPDFDVAVPHRWKDQLSIRAGGDWNVIPGVLALRTGASYETRGFRKGYAFADYFPLERLGIHAGLTVRINRWEVSGGYAHFFMKTFDNGDGLTRQVVNVPPPAGEIPDTYEPVLDGDVTNGGKYSARINIGSIALRYFFR